MELITNKNKNSIYILTNIVLLKNKVYKMNLFIIDYNNIKKIIINILNDETTDSGLSTTKENKNKKCKILKLPSVKPRD